MRAQHRSTGILAAAALLSILPASVARAESEPPSWAKEKPEPRLELFLSSLMANSTIEGSFGLRGAFPSAVISPSRGASAA